MPHSDTKLVLKYRLHSVILTIRKHVTTFTNSCLATTCNFQHGTRGAEFNGARHGELVM